MVPKAAEAQKQHPDDARFPRLQASALFAAGDKPGAIGVLETTVRAFPKDTTAQLALVDMYGQVGRKALQPVRHDRRMQLSERRGGHLGVPV